MQQTSDNPAQVWLVEDNHLFREGLSAVVEATEDLSCPLAVASCEAALDALDRGEVPDLVLLDIGLPGIDGIEGAHRIRERSPETRVLILTIHDEGEKIFQALCAGASGYLLKSATSDQIVDALREVRRGGAPMSAYIARKVLDRFAPYLEREGDYGLTSRERQILELLVDGLAMKEVSSRLDISFHTVDTHIRNIYQKLHVRSRSAAVAKALRERLV